VDAGYETEEATVGGRTALVGRRSDFRWRWVATRLHTFVFVFAEPELDEATAEDLTSAAQDYAIKRKGGLPRGFQTGIAAVPVFISESAASTAWFEQKPKPRYAALRFPVLADLTSGTLTYFRGRMTIGAVYASHLRGVAEKVVAPAFQS
jgi:hypothetical protein